MAKVNKFRSYPKGSESRKGDKSKVGPSMSHPKIKEEKKSKWMISDTGAMRTKVSFPKSNKATVGKSSGLIRKTSRIRSSTGKVRNVVI